MMNLYIKDYKKSGFGQSWENILPYLSDEENQKIKRMRALPDKIRSAAAAYMARTAEWRVIVKMMKHPLGRFP